MDQEAQVSILAAVEKEETDRGEAKLRLLTLAKRKEFCLTKTIKAINKV